MISLFITFFTWFFRNRRFLRLKWKDYCLVETTQRVFFTQGLWCHIYKGEEEIICLSGTRGHYALYFLYVIWKKGQFNVTHFDSLGHKIHVPRFFKKHCCMIFHFQTTGKYMRWENYSPETTHSRYCIPIDFKELDGHRESIIQMFDSTDINIKELGYKMACELIQHNNKNRRGEWLGGR